MGNHCCNKMSSSRNSSNSKLDSKLDSMKFEPHHAVQVYATSRQFRVDGHFKSARNNRRAVFTKLSRPLAKDRKNTSYLATYLAIFSVSATYEVTDPEFEP